MLVLIFLFIHVCQSFDIETRMVIDLIVNQVEPTFIISPSCWTLVRGESNLRPQDRKADPLTAEPCPQADKYIDVSIILLPEKQALFVKIFNANDNMIQFKRLDTKPLIKVNSNLQQGAILIDTDCPSVEQYLKMAESLDYLKPPYRWLFISFKESVSSNISKEFISPPKYLESLKSVLVDSEVMVANRINETHFQLNKYYKKWVNGEWIVEFFGTWNDETKLNLYIPSVPTALRRINLNGTVIPISYVLTNNDSINHLEDYKDDHIDTITKVSFPLTNHLLDFLNADRRYLFTDSWGYLIDGNWTGMIGQMTRNEAEIGGSPMFFTSDRLSVVEFVSSPTPSRSKFVFRQPKLSYENNVFILPFRQAVWYCSMGLVFILLTGLLCVTAWEWKVLHKTENYGAGILRAKLSDIGMFIWGAACQQGSTVELKGSLGRVVMFILFLSFMFLYTSYAANIVALLQSSSSKIKTLNDLLNSRLKLGVDDNVFNHYYFSHATEPVRKAIYTSKIAPPGAKPNFMTMDEGVSKMRQGLFAFHMETGVGYKFVGKLFHEDEKCGLKEIQYLQVIDPFLAIKKGTPYREMFKIGMRRIQEFGLTSRENSLFYAKKPHCGGRGSSFISVTMVDCYPALAILSYGALCSVCIFIIEYLLHEKDKIIRKLKGTAAR